MTKQEKLFALIEKWERSGQSKAEFARERGIPLPTFHYWYRQYQEHQARTVTPTFIELPSVEVSKTRREDLSSREPRLSVEFPDGVRISIY